jgi:hypothetical protein
MDLHCLILQSRRVYIDGVPVLACWFAMLSVANATLAQWLLISYLRDGMSASIRNIKNKAATG